MRRLVFVAATTLVFGLGSERAEAQWGWGWGFGGAFNAGGGYSNMATLNYINQRSNQAAAYAYSSRSSIGGGNVYAGNPNAYINHVRDNSNDRFFDRYDVSTRRVPGTSTTALASLAGSPGGEIPPAPDPTGRERPAEPQAPKRPRAPSLASFLTAAGKLAWPSEAPTTGDLESKREAVDEAVEAVQGQAALGGQVPIGLITEARTRLLNYGRPALAYARQHATPAVADTFHNFLASLYDALGAAASPSSE